MENVGKITDGGSDFAKNGLQLLRIYYFLTSG